LSLLTKETNCTLVFCSWHLSSSSSILIISDTTNPRQ
jgi:hypothetical protein